jgi:hypothetical protein
MITENRVPIADGANLGGVSFDGVDHRGARDGVEEVGRGDDGSESEECGLHGDVSVLDRWTDT